MRIIYLSYQVDSVNSTHVQPSKNTHLGIFWLRVMVAGPRSTSFSKSRSLTWPFALRMEEVADSAAQSEFELFPLSLKGVALPSRPLRYNSFP